MQPDKNFNYFSLHTEWYEFIAGVGFVPNDLATIQATIAMLEYDYHTFGKEQGLYEKQEISEKVKFLLENEYPKNKIVMVALGENGLDKITELFNREKELLRLKQECEKLTDWEESHEK